MGIFICVYIYIYSSLPLIIVFKALKMVHLYRNMSELRLYVLNTVHLVGKINLMC
jgi:hypothetical protein